MNSTFLTTKPGTFNSILTMSETFFEVFTHPKHYDNWDKQIAYAARREGVSEETRANWIRALIFLKEELGKGFLKSAPRNHPIGLKVANKAPWQVADLIDFARTLEALKATTSSYPKLLGKLRPVDECREEGIPFVDIARAYGQVGCDITFLQEKPPGRMPDIEVLNPSNQDKFYIEVSHLRNSDDNLRISENYRALFNALELTWPGLPYFCRQLDYIAPSEMTGVLDKIADLKQTALRQEKLVYHSDEKIEVTIAHPAANQALQDWCKAKGVEASGLFGLPHDTDIISRMVRNKKIIDKASQIPAGHAGIIYFPVDPHYFLTNDLSRAVIAFERQINAFPNLLGVVLYASLIDPGEETATLVQGHFYGKKMMNEAVMRHMFFIFNHKFESTLLKEDTVSKIYEAFR